MTGTPRNEAPFSKTHPLVEDVGVGGDQVLITAGAVGDVGQRDGRGGLGRQRDGGRGQVKVAGNRDAGDWFLFARSDRGCS